MSVPSSAPQSTAQRAINKISCRSWRVLSARGSSRSAKQVEKDSRGRSPGVGSHADPVHRSSCPQPNFICNSPVTPGNWDDRAPVLALLDGVEGGVTLGDLGYRGRQRAEEWA